MKCKSPKKIALLYGGVSPERDVSLSSKEVMEKALLELGHEVIPVDVVASTLASLPTLECDLVFMAMHGDAGENGCIQGILEASGIPYTHSGVVASSVCMDKPVAKLVFKGLGADVAFSKIVTKEEILSGKKLHTKKYLLKPTNSGSSNNIVIVSDENNLNESNYPFEGEVMLEEFIAGHELSVAFLNKKVLGGLEVRLKGVEYYTSDAKYKGILGELIPVANIPDKVYQEALVLTEKICTSIHCRGAVRADFIYDDKADKLFVLELNTCPGMTIFSRIAKVCANLDIKEIAKEIINDVEYRHHDVVPDTHKSKILTINS